MWPPRHKKNNSSEHRETGSRIKLIWAKESILVMNLKELGRQWVIASCLICTENWAQNQFSSGSWPVTWKIKKWGVLQIAAEVILQKPGTGEKRQLNFSYALWSVLWTFWLIYACNLLKPLLIISFITDQRHHSSNSGHCLKLTQAHRHKLNCTLIYNPCTPYVC